MFNGKEKAQTLIEYALLIALILIAIIIAFTFYQTQMTSWANYLVTIFDNVLRQVQGQPPVAVTPPPLPDFDKIIVDLKDYQTQFLAWWEQFEVELTPWLDTVTETIKGWLD